MAVVRWRPILTVPAIAPAWSPEWDGPGANVYRRTIVTDPGAEGYMATSFATVDEADAPQTVYLQQFIATDGLPTGLLYGVFRSAWPADVFYTNVAVDRHLRVIARVLDATGTVERGVIFDGISSQVTTVEDVTRAVGGRILPGVVAQEGDILVVEVGGHVGAYDHNNDHTVRLEGYPPSTSYADLPYEDGPLLVEQSAWVEIDTTPARTGIAYGYQLYATRPITRPEVRIDGWWMSGINPWGSLRTSTRLTGDWEASWSFIRPPTRQTLRHPAFRHGSPVEVMLGPIPVWVGSLIEPDWDSGELVAMGAPRQGEDAQALTATGQTTTKPDIAIDQAIARGVLDWTRGHTFGSTAIGEADDVGDLSSIARLLDAWVEDADNPSGWRVDRQRILRAVNNSEAIQPAWFITPGSGELGVADDDRADRIFLRYSDNTVGGALRTASYPASTPAGGVERRGSIVHLGPMTPAKATKYAEGIWRKMNGHSGWTNGLRLTRSQITTTGGLPANLALIKAGDTIRLLGVQDPRALAHHLDVVIGETDLDWEAGEIQVNPVGLAARTFEAVLEEVVPGATAA